MPDFVSERLKAEHAYNVGERKTQRRKFLKNIATKAAAVGLATATFVGVSNAIEQGEKDKYQPDAYYNGKVEIVMTENLNVRETPVIVSTPNEAEPNTVDWDDVEEINGVNVKDQDSFVIEKPLITEGDDPEGPGTKGEWITLNAKVNGASERLFVNFSSTTSDYVKPVETGSLIKVSNPTALDYLGKVTVSK